MKYPGINQQPADNEHDSSLRKALRRALREQFGRPSGLVGRLAGAIMSRAPSNLERIDWTLALLDLAPEDRILEVGFGPGVALERASRIANRGKVFGIDHSEAMVRQAARRNARAVREGRVELQLGSAAAPPAFGTPLDKIFSINSIHFWEQPVDCLSRLRMLLRTGGRIAIVLQPRSRAATHESAIAIGQELARNLGAAGFRECRLEFRDAQPVPVACALGIR